MHIRPGDSVKHDSILTADYWGAGVSDIPEVNQDQMYQLLRKGKILEFNELKATGEACDLRNGDFRGLDLRGVDARGLDFSNGDFRHADLRGIDFYQSCLDGASLSGAKIAGTYFPPELSAEEVSLSLLHGTRVRQTKCSKET